MTSREVVQKFRQRRGAWATVGDHLQSSSFDTIWYPVVNLDPKTIDLSIAVFKVDESEWALKIDNKEVDWAEKPDSLRERFDRTIRSRHIRSKALPLIPTDEQAAELLEYLAHPKKAKSGDYVLLYTDGGILDVVQVRKINHKIGKARIFGDAVEIDTGLLCPPTAHRKKQYLNGLFKLKCPIEGACATNGQAVYPDVASTSVVGRPEVSIAFRSTNRSSGNYVYVEFELTNNSQVSLQLSEYDFKDRESTPIGLTPFAYQSNKRLMVFQLFRCGGRILYPGNTERFTAAIGCQPGLDLIKLFVPSGLLGGAIGTYTLVEFVAPPANSVETM